MAGHGYSWLLQLYLLLLAAQPLDHSSHPKRDMGTSALLPEELELQDMDLKPSPWVDTVLVSWTFLLLDLLTMGIFLGCCLGRRLRRYWREEKCKSPPACAVPRCCQGRCCRGRGCPKKLMQLLRYNRAMLQLCLCYCSQQRHRAKTAAKGGIWKRRRFPASLQR